MTHVQWVIEASMYLSSILNAAIPVGAAIAVFLLRFCFIQHLIGLIKKRLPVSSSPLMYNCSNKVFYLT